MAGFESLRLAVLIDSDNTSGKLAREIVAELAKYGTPTVKRAYGDWTTPRLSGWKDQLHLLAIQPVQQFAYTSGKNSTDSALIIDAMDLLYSNAVDGFCIVSSDSDFTRLATRLRESGKTVVGMGRRTTPAAFIAACDKFIYLELLGLADPGASKADTAPAALRAILTPAITGSAKESGWSSLSAVGQLIGKNHAAFDPRDYGFARLSELVRTLDYVEVKDVPDVNNFLHPWVRLKARR